MSIAKQLPVDFADNIAKNAGVILSSFNTSDWTVARSAVIGATTGGITFSDTPEYADYGEDIDNCPKNTKELKQIIGREVKVEGTFVSLAEEAMKQVIATADLASHAITPRDEVKLTDFADLWFVFDYGEDSAVAIELKDCLSTGGLSIKTNDNEKGTYAFSFTAHYSMTNPDTVPYKVYFKSK